ncbi:DEAD/DEAH box helicase [Promicromonospora sukumoe]|uniref:DEAD/DEAH box helicase n=1 Tax=Promicromonospora sukumoe TaxID=88382 RepID=UPI001E5A90B9|nr:DEAD/DEAH box helicase [Promicromonospora sukumoe]
MTTFADLGLPAPVVRVLADRGITSPFPIQTASLPDSLAGRDVLGRGRTGSGKTLAFALPVVTRLAMSGARSAASGQPRRAAGRPRALVLAPTRELANQIDESVAPLAQALGLKTTTIFGGVAQSRQVTALNAGVDIVIACPGRLEDLLGQRHLTLDDVEITVLDEADHMADLGFLPGVKRILDKTGARTQRLLFSATLDNGVDVLVKRYLHQPVTHSVDDAAAPPPQMTHHILAVADKDAKKNVVQQLAQGTGRRVLFTRTKHQAKKLAKQLTAAGVPAVDLHGNLGQGARERNLAAFSSGEVKVLVATDIAARGIHVDDVELVVHVDPPAEHKAYLHRSGRTARAGSGGDVVTLMLPEERGDVRDLTRKAKITARPQDVAPGDATVTSLVGEVAPYVEYVPPAPQQPARQGQPKRQGGRGRSGQGAAQGGRQGSGQGGVQGGRQGQSRGQGTGGTGSGQAAGQRGGGRPASGGGRTAADHFPRPDGAPRRRRRGGRGRGAGNPNAPAAN